MRQNYIKILKMFKNVYMKNKWDPPQKKIEPIIANDREGLLKIPK